MRRWIVWLCVMSAPSAWLAWRGRDMPQLGSLADDAIYMVSGKSLASGEGYRIASLPGDPAQTKYPPGYPLLLSAVWWMSPRFPENLGLGALVAWAPLPLLLTLSRKMYRRMGLGPRHAAILCGLMAVSAPVVWFSMNLMPELLFLSVLLGSVLVADEREKWWQAGAAGLLGGVAFLLKSAALPLLATSPLLYLARKQRRAAGLFFAGMAPFVAGWMWWARAHHNPPGDSTWTFYTDYSAYQALNVGWKDYPLVIWVNLKTLASSLGELIAAPALKGPLGHTGAFAGAVLAVAGVVLLARRKGVTHYHAFGAGLVALLVVWHYPPIARFALPLEPMLLAGISVTAMAAWQVAKQQQGGGPRVAALAALGTMTLLVPLALAGIYVGPLASLNGVVERDRGRLAGLAQEYGWIRAHTPVDAAFVASDDAVLYLYTGRRAMALHIPPKMLYHEDVAGIAREYRTIGEFAARNHLDYLLWTPTDFEQDFTPAMGRAEVEQVLGDGGRFRLVDRRERTAVYEVTGGGGIGGR